MEKLKKLEDARRTFSPRGEVSNVYERGPRAEPKATFGKGQIELDVVDAKEVRPFGRQGRQIVFG